MEKTNRRLWAFFLILLGVALGGSIWGWANPAPCDACDGAREMLPGLNLAPIGVTYYAILLGAAVLLGPNRFTFAGISFAAAIHAVLLTLLVSRGLFCVPCVVTGLSAIGAMAASFWIDPRNLARASVLLPAGAIASHALLFSLGAVSAVAPSERARAKVDQLAEVAPAVPVGRASMLIYTRQGCRFCDELERDVLPSMIEQFGTMLEVERRVAPAGLPSPTIVISGATRTVFPGLPSRHDLARAITRAIGGKENVASMLPQPR